MTNDKHEKAVDAATKAWMDDRGIDATVDHRRDHWRESISIAISAYLEAIGGVVCDRKPVASLLVDPDGELAPQATTRPQEPSDLLEIIALHTPLIADKGDDGWGLIDDEAKSGEDILAVRVDDHGDGHYEVVYYELTDGAPWVWHTHDGLAYHEEAFSHYRSLPAPPSIPSNEESGE